MKGMKLIRHVGKGATEQRLPSRSALNTLTAGSPVDRSMSNYAKATPTMGPSSMSPPAMLPSSSPSPNLYSGGDSDNDGA
jgi:hypothetical protein